MSTSASLDQPGLPLAPQELAEFESRVGQSLPPAFRQFLLQQNGGKCVKAAFDFVSADGTTNSSWIRHFLSAENGGRVSIEQTARFYWDAGRLPKDLLPIAEDVGNNLLCLDLSKAGSDIIYFWDHELEHLNSPARPKANISPVAPSIVELLKHLHA